MTCSIEHGRIIDRKPLKERTQSLEDVETIPNKIQWKNLICVQCPKH